MCTVVIDYYTKLYSYTMRNHVSYNFHTCKYLIHILQCIQVVHSYSNKVLCQYVHMYGKNDAVLKCSLSRDWWPTFCLHLTVGCIILHSIRNGYFGGWDYFGRYRTIQN